MNHLEHMTVQVEWKSDAPWVPDEWKADAADPGILIGYASTFGNVDRGGDVVVKGAFTKTIENIKANGIPLLADHMASTSSVLGTIFDAKQDAKGLLIKARISNAPSAQDVAIKAREGHLNKMSIGYETMDDALEDREVDGMVVKVRLLKEVKLWETSVVVFPMNPEAAITGMKQMVIDFLPESPTRKALVTALEESETAVNDTATLNKPDESQAGPPEVAEAAGAAKGDDPPNAGGEPASAPDEGAAGYDKWTSRALLHGHPIEEVDPVKRAALATRLQLAESQLPPITDEE